MLLSIGADERAALQFEDLASALDAGLPVVALGGDAAAGDLALHGALRQRGVVLSPTEHQVLLHAWRAGKASQALRRCATGRVRRAAFARKVWEGLRYPLLLFVLVLMASLATAPVLGPGFLIGVLVAYTVLTVLALVLRAAVRAGAPWLARVPVLGHLLAGLGELPYLETLHALYGAGVPLKEAHSAAVGTVTVAAVRDRLRIADRVLQAGQPLALGLDQALALHPETRSLLGTGERAGQLEEALQRALTRRSDVVGRELADAARRLGQFAYFAAVAACVVLIFRFYSDYLGRIGGMRR